MESLIRQTRVRFAGENKDQGSSISDRRLPPQKTQSFKGEKKKQVSWLQRQFSGQMGKEYDPNNGGEYSAAIAAAAFAIQALEELNIKEQKKIIEEHEKSFSKIKSRTDDTTPRVPDAGKISRRFSAEPSMKTEDNIPQKAAPAIPIGETKLPDKAVGPTPIKKTATFAEKLTDISTSRKPETASMKPDLPYTKEPISPANFRRLSTSIPGFEETEADTWEKAELAKIKERYETLGLTISDWEKKKKEKAKRKKDRIESELELKRAKALKQHHTDMDRIDQIAAGARSQAEDNRRNEEFKVKEKANRIRTTGKIPATCLCF